MSNTDKLFLQSLISTLSQPLPSSPASSPAALPTALIKAVNDAHSRALKLKLTSGAVRQGVEQLAQLRLEREELRDRRRGKDGGRRISVERTGDWIARLGELDDEDGEHDLDEKERYVKLLRRVKHLRAIKSRKQQQLAHYEKLALLTAELNPETIEDHFLDSSSLVSPAITATDSLGKGLKRANHSLSHEAKLAECVAAKRSRSGHLARHADGESHLSSTAELVKSLGGVNRS
ncbi:hypothetical protein T439DRAFT_326996 [Meredithblackwellia eburnea MCA 4105]